MTFPSLLYIQRGAYGRDVDFAMTSAFMGKAASAAEDFYGVTSWTRDLSDDSRQSRQWLCPKKD